jgi:hypothetical protein
MQSMLAKIPKFKVFLLIFAFGICGCATSDQPRKMSDLALIEEDGPPKYLHHDFRNQFTNTINRPKKTNNPRARIVNFGGLLIGLNWAEEGKEKSGGLNYFKSVDERLLPNKDYHKIIADHFKAENINCCVAITSTGLGAQYHISEDELEAATLSMLRLMEKEDVPFYFHNTKFKVLPNRDDIKF